MIITKTPYRISFFGGGTDYPGWYRENGGAVLATSINKYCYITCRRLPPFFEHKHRIVYSLIESVNSIGEIRHPSVRSVLGWSGISDGLEIHHDGDLPARSGIGSSSSFTVGLIHALNAFSGKMTQKDQLARDAINIEQNLIGENVGSQDQISAAFGGINRIDFNRDDSFNVSPLSLALERRIELRNHLMLFFTGISRVASDVAKSKIDNLKAREVQLRLIRNMVDESISILQSASEPIRSFGKLLNESWRYKRDLSDRVSTPEIDDIYQAAMEAGAIGGKLLGAGGGGFLLLFAEPARQSVIRERLRNLVYVPFDFEHSGSRVVLYQPDGFG